MWCDSTDHSLLLPDELLCHVFSYMSLEDKLRLESVNSKFQRCIIRELKARPIELNVSDGKFNNFHMHPNLMIAALQTLVKKTKFASIYIDSRCVDDFERVDWLNNFLSQLIYERPCLKKVVSVTLNSTCSQVVLEKFLENCEDLKIVKFDFYAELISNSNNSDYKSECELHLGQLFKNTAFTELTLRPYHYHPERLIDMFSVIKPNTLTKVHLFLHRLLPGFNMVELVNAVDGNARCSLEELHLEFVMDVVLADLFDAVARLPVLRKCSIECYSHQPQNQQFVVAVNSLLTMSNVDITVTVYDVGDHTQTPPACQFINNIQQIRRNHSLLKVEFDFDGYQFILSLGSASIRTSFIGRVVPRCDAEQCLQCQSFYPTVLSFVRGQSFHAATTGIAIDQQFPDWRLDRCRVDQILVNLKKLSGYSRPVSADLSANEQMVRIHFQAKVLRHHFFSITLSCGQCLSNVCAKCY